MKCVLCGSKIRLEKMDPRKEERIKKGLPSLEEFELVRKVCRNCGHVSYGKIKK